jgi:CRP/FNR family transcriptional regulator
MRIAQDLEIEDKCQDCRLKSKDFFCQLPAVNLVEFDSIKVTKAYPKGATLFVEGQPSDGVYMLCQGKVKLSTCSSEGKIIILEIADAGSILGLSAAVNRVEHETTAEVLELCQVSYVKTTDFLQFLQRNSEASLNAARQLSRNYQTAYRQICSLGLSDSVVDRLARLFLDWSRRHSDHALGNGNGSVHLKNFFTHEEMAEMVGASRETVTRALKYFRQRELISLKGSDLIILDRKRLEAAIGTRPSVRSEM